MSDNTSTSAQAPHVPPVLYTVRGFDVDTGVITVEWDNGEYSRVHLPVNPKGEVPTGDDLTIYLLGFRPIVPETRTITNAPMIEAMVVPAPLPPVPALTWDDIRRQRDERLADSDWAVLSDVPMSDEKRTEWMTHRQALRDITETFAAPALVVWPPEPDNPYDADR